MGIGKHFGSSSGNANKPKNKQNYKKTSWHQCQCSCSSQIPSQDDLNYNQFLSLYKLRRNRYKTELVIYNTDSKREKVKILDTELLGPYTITQLPNGELFCSDNYKITFIIDKSYAVRYLPFVAFHRFSSALYFDNNIYCFEGFVSGRYEKPLLRKFDLKNNRWSDLTSLPKTDIYSNSVIFNGNILVSGHNSKNFLLYSIEIDSFSTLPYEFEAYTRKVLINVERLYLIEWSHNGIIYESEDEYHWKQISKSGKLHNNWDPMYCLYNKGKIYISNAKFYYQFDLKKKVVRKIK